MHIDSRLEQGGFWLMDFSLCRVYLKDNQDYPWLVLVPMVEGVTEILELTVEQQVQLMNDITHASRMIKSCFEVEKINVASLGNIVTQLHVHVVGRSVKDPLWPHAIWQADLQANPYKHPQKWTQLLREFSEVRV
jgi:diadenosine tetraphosphate (Ap4A) HIT family hydrolase